MLKVLCSFKLLCSSSGIFLCYSLLPVGRLFELGHPRVNLSKCRVNRMNTVPLDHSFHTETFQDPKGPTQCHHSAEALKTPWAGSKKFVQSHQTLCYRDFIIIMCLLFFCMTATSMSKYWYMISSGLPRDNEQPGYCITQQTSFQEALSGKSLYDLETGSRRHFEIHLSW